MPVGKGRYRVTTTSTGKKVRLHFTPGGTVNEAKNLATGATHTPKEFKADMKRSMHGSGPMGAGEMMKGYRDMGKCK